MSDWIVLSNKSRSFSAYFCPVYILQYILRRWYLWDCAWEFPAPYLSLFSIVAKSKEWHLHKKKLKILLNNRNRWKCAINYRRRCHQSWLNILTLIVVIIMRSCVFKNWFMDLLFLGFFSVTYILDSRCIPSFMSPLLNFNCTETQIVLKEPVLFGVPPPLLWWKQSFSPSQLHFRITSLV